MQKSKPNDCIVINNRIYPASRWKHTNIGNYLIDEKGIIVNGTNGKQLKSFDNGKGYKRVDLLGTNYYVHRLVAKIFHGSSIKPQVNHKDYDRANNHKNNLEWSTAKENIQHQRKKKFWGNKPPDPNAFKDVPF